MVIKPLKPLIQRDHVACMPLLWQDIQYGYLPPPLHLGRRFTYPDVSVAAFNAVCQLRTKIHSLMIDHSWEGNLPD